MGNVGGVPRVFVTPARSITMSTGYMEESGRGRKHRRPAGVRYWEGPHLGMWYKWGTRVKCYSPGQTGKSFS